MVLPGLPALLTFPQGVFLTEKRLLYMTGLLCLISDILGIVKGDRDLAKTSLSVATLAELTGAVCKHHFKTSVSSVLTVSP